MIVALAIVLLLGFFYAGLCVGFHFGKIFGIDKMKEALDKRGVILHIPPSRETRKTSRD